MRHLIILLFALPLAIISLSAQENTSVYEYSSEIKLRPQDEYDGLLHSDTTGYLINIFENRGRGILDLPGNRLILEKYDTKFKQVFSYEYGDENMITLDIISMDTYLAWIVMEKVGSYRYACSMIPIYMDGKQGQKEFLYETPIEKLSQVPYTFVKKSPNGQKLSIIALFDANSKKESVEIFTTVVNDKGTIQWDKFTTLRGNQKQYNISDFEVTDSGEIVCVSKVYKDEKAKDKVKNRRDQEVAGYSMNLFKINHNTTKPQKVTLEVEGEFVHDASIKILESGDIICSGLTSTKHNGNITGIFYARYQSDFVPIEMDTKRFNFNDLVDLSQEEIDVNIKKKKKMGIDNNYDLSDIIPLSDGSILMTMEQNYIRSSTTGYNNFDPAFSRGINSRQRTDTYLVSNDILIVNVTSRGEISQINIVPKKQSFLIQTGFFRPSIDVETTRKSSPYLSYSYFIKNDQVYFIYNDHKDNLVESTRSKRKILHRFNQIESALVSINNLEAPGYFFADQDEDLVVSPTRSKQIGENKLFFSTIQPAGRNSVLRIGVMTFN